MTYLAHWIALDAKFHVAVEGDERVEGHDVDRVSEGLLTVAAIERVTARIGRPVVVTSLVAVA